MAYEFWSSREFAIASSVLMTLTALVFYAWYQLKKPKDVERKLDPYLTYDQFKNDLLPWLGNAPIDDILCRCREKGVPEKSIVKSSPHCECRCHMKPEYDNSICLKCYKSPYLAEDWV